jgi:hypothetical protein
MLLHIAVVSVFILQVRTYILSLYPNLFVKDLYIILKFRPRKVQFASNSQVNSHYHLVVYCSLLVTIRYNVKRLNSDWSGCTTVLCSCGRRQQVLLIIMQFTQSEFGAVEHR